MFGEAIAYFERTLRLDSDYHEARLELARMYLEGWGVESDLTKGFELMRTVAERADEEVRSIAKANLGMFYLNGRGVETEKERGIESLRQALAEGSPYAAKILESYAE